MDEPVTADPNYKARGMANLRALWGWRIRMASYWMQERHIPGARLLFRIGVRF